MNTIECRDSDADGGSLLSIQDSAAVESCVSTAPTAPIANPRMSMQHSTNHTLADSEIRHDEYYTDPSGRPLHIADPNDDEDGHVSESMSHVASSLATSLNKGVDHSLAHWKILAFGQILSFLLAGTGAASATLHLECNLSAPAFQSLFLYVALALHIFFLPGCSNCTKKVQPLSSEADATPSHHDTLSRIRSQEEFRDDDDGGDYEDDGKGTPSDSEEGTGVHLAPAGHSLFCGFVPLHAPVWAYFLIAFLDVEANYLTFLSFRYTTFTSITLFDSLAIPASMIFSRLALGRRYRLIHIGGAVVCMIGVIFNVLSDYKSDMDAERNEEKIAAQASSNGFDDGSDEYPHKILGDFLAIAGGILYGLNDVLAEMAVKTWGGQTEFIALLGLFGTMVSAVQTVALELDHVRHFFRRTDLTSAEETWGMDDEELDHEPTCTKAAGFGLLFLYVLANYVSYVGVARFLVYSESALLNLSLLTGDLWAVVFVVFAERIIPQPLFWVALTLIISGVFIYEIGPSPIVKERRPSDVKFRLSGHDSSNGSHSADGGVEQNDLRWGDDVDAMELQDRTPPAIT